jgi:hypothetical protein
MKRVNPDPVPPRHTFNDDESTDEEDINTAEHPLQVSAYQDSEDQEMPRTKKMELGEATVSLTGEIQKNPTVLIGVDLFHGVEAWFNSSTEVGQFTTKVSST